MCPYYKILNIVASEPLVICFLTKGFGQIPVILIEFLNLLYALVGFFVFFSFR